MFKVHTKDGVVEFKPSERGLHYHDASEEDSNLELMFVNTVQDNFEGYARHPTPRYDWKPDQMRIYETGA